MYEKLKSMGFDVPPPVTNANKQQMEQAMRDFVGRMRPGGANIFYYSGHGVQIGGANYLLPVGLAKDSVEIDVTYNAVRLDYIANLMYSVVSDFNFLIIDACRNTPFYRRWSRPKGSGSQGLALIAPPAGTMIAYAAEPGEVANDGDDKSPFTASLLNYLGSSGMTIYDMLHRVRDEVLSLTNQDQRPAWEGSPNEYNFSFLPSAVRPTPQPDPPSSRPPSTPPSNNRPSEPTLISAATGVNYQPLKDALVARDYRLADQTTANLMVRAAGREAEGALREADGKNFSCDDLKIIDQLWLDHSNGKFGFSVQQQIYKSLGGTPGQYNETIYRQFGDQVGWLQNNQWMPYGSLNFSATAPMGHLPVGPPTGDLGGGRWEVVGIFAVDTDSGVVKGPFESIFLPVELCRLSSSRPPSTPPSNNRPSEPTLISAATGVNYQPLKDALVARDYRLADQTTANLMVRAAGREAEGALREADGKNFSCDDLKIIDQLWLDHSNGKFGFSVQQQIYKSLGGTPGQYNETIYRQFGDQVGWLQNNQWMPYGSLNFSATAPMGHLPVGPPTGDLGGGRWEVVGIFAVDTDSGGLRGPFESIFLPVEPCRL
jgi:hypothetical protein